MMTTTEVIRWLQGRTDESLIWYKGQRWEPHRLAMAMSLADYPAGQLWELNHRGTWEVRPHVTIDDDKAQKLYLSYVNDFLTVERWAEFHGLDNHGDIGEAQALLNRGRNVHESRTQ